MSSPRLRRRRLLRSVGALPSLPLARSVRGRSDDGPTEAWPEFGYGPRNTGAPDDNTGPVANVHEAWRYAAGSRVDSSPAVVGDSVYVGSDDGTLFAVDASDGTERWRFETGDTIVSAPAVHDGTVYCCSLDGTLYAVAAEDGSLEWEYPADSSLWASPTVSGGTVYIASRGGTLSAVDPDGTERWTATLGGELGAPVATDERVYVGSDARRVVALSTTSGDRRWEFDLEKAGIPSLAVGADALYVGTGQRSGRLSALGLDGTERWTFDTLNSIDRSPAVTDDAVYAGTAGGDVVALRTDGTESWRFDPEFVVVSAPAVVSETVYVGDVGGTVYALSAAEGRELWRFSTDGPVGSSPAVVDGRVYVGSGDGSLYALGGDPPDHSGPTDSPGGPGGTRTVLDAVSDRWPFAALAGLGSVSAWYGWTRLRDRGGDDSTGE